MRISTSCPSLSSPQLSLGLISHTPTEEMHHELEWMLRYGIDRVDVGEWLGFGTCGGGGGDEVACDGVVEPKF